MKKKLLIVLTFFSFALQTHSMLSIFSNSATASAKSNAEIRSYIISLCVHSEKTLGILVSPRFQGHAFGDDFVRRWLDMCSYRPGGPNCTRFPFGGGTYLDGNNCHHFGLFESLMTLLNQFVPGAAGNNVGGAPVGGAPGVFSVVADTNGLNDVYNSMWENAASPNGGAACGGAAGDTQGGSVLRAALAIVPTLFLDANGNNGGLPLYQAGNNVTTIHHDIMITHIADPAFIGTPAAPGTLSAAGASPWGGAAVNFSDSCLVIAAVYLSVLESGSLWNNALASAGGGGVGFDYVSQAQGAPGGAVPGANAGIVAVDQLDKLIKAANL